MKYLLENWHNFINESSLSRLYRHIQEYDAAIITAHRTNLEDTADCLKLLPLVDNGARNKALKAVLLYKGYGVTVVDGSYVENFKDPDPLKRVEVSEESFFVANLQDEDSFIEQIGKFGELFCQDSVLIIPRGGEDAYLLGTNNSLFPGRGNREFVGDFSAGAEAEFMSKIRGRPFTFKEVKEMETYRLLPKNTKWAITKMVERVFKDEN
tara:strand:+ start:10306 stop:10935 length:630 start_codon:yes stop_codon:yes gene_type:complete